jgi:hypothetical protein
VKTFLIALLISTGASICFWQFGLGGRIWPAHPFLVSLAITVACGIVVQLLFSHNTAGPK